VCSVITGTSLFFLTSKHFLYSFYQFKMIISVTEDYRASLFNIKFLNTIAHYVLKTQLNQNTF